MKVSKALQLLKDERYNLNAPFDKDHLTALGLGIEALERLRKARQRSTRSVHALLPGETYEEAG